MTRIAVEVGGTFTSAHFGVAVEEGGHLCFDRLGEQSPRAFAQNLGKRIAKSPWLGQA